MCDDGHGWQKPPEPVRFPPRLRVISNPAPPEDEWPESVSESFDIAKPVNKPR